MTEDFCAARPTRRRRDVPVVIIDRPSLIHDAVEDGSSLPVPKPMTRPQLMRLHQFAIQLNSSNLAHGAVRLLIHHILSSEVNTSSAMAVLLRDMLDFVISSASVDYAATSIGMLLDCECSPLSTFRTVTAITKLVLRKGGYTRYRSVLLAMFGYQTSCSEMAQVALRGLVGDVPMFDASTARQLVRQAVGRLWSAEDIRQLMRWILCDEPMADPPVDVPEHDRSYRYLLMLPVVQAVWRRATRRLSRHFWSAMSECCQEEEEEAVFLPEEPVKPEELNGLPHGRFDPVDLHDWQLLIEQLMTLTDGVFTIDSWIIPYLGIALRQSLTILPADASELDREYEQTSHQVVWDATIAALAHGADPVRMSFGAPPTTTDVSYEDIFWRWQPGPKADQLERSIYQLANASMTTIAPMQLYLDRIAPRRTAATCGRVKI